MRADVDCAGGREAGAPGVGEEGGEVVVAVFFGDEEVEVEVWG